MTLKDSPYLDKLQRDIIASARRELEEEVDRLKAALRPFAEQARKKAHRYERVGSPQFETMPGHWPIEVTVTMDEVRRARDAIYPSAIRSLAHQESDS